MQPITVRVFVSSTWLDLQPERDTLESLLQRFRETKFIGMEYFGSRDETTRRASLDEIDQSDIYLGVIGDRYGSGITEAEYDHAHARKKPCFIYFKRGVQVPSESRGDEPARDQRLEKFKAKLRDQASGHLVSEFFGPAELALVAASDLHNWLAPKLLALAAEEAAKGRFDAEQSRRLEGALGGLAALNRDLREEVEKRRAIVETQLDAFFRLTYDVRQALMEFKGTERIRERFARQNVAALTRLWELDPGAHDVRRELATNYRILGEVLSSLREWREAHAAYEDSKRHTIALVETQPDNALYRHDLALSYLNGGIMLHQLGDTRGARDAYMASLPHARRAAELDSRWASLPGKAQAAIDELK